MSELLFETTRTLQKINKKHKYQFKINQMLKDKIVKQKKKAKKDSIEK